MLNSFMCYIETYSTKLNKFLSCLTSNEDYGMSTSLLDN